MSRIDKLDTDGTITDVRILFELAITVGCEAHCCAPSARPARSFAPKSDDPDMPGARRCKHCDKDVADHTSSLRCSAPIVTGGVEATFVLGITDTEEVLVRNAADPVSAPWRHAEMFLPIAIQAHGLKFATKHDTDTDKKDQEP